MSIDGSSSTAPASDLEQIDAHVRTFFAAFTSGPDLDARMDDLRSLFLPAAVIVRTCGGEPTVYGVEDFIAPRKALLSNGKLANFREWQTAGQTEVFGDIAQHWCSYAKAGIHEGVSFTGRGKKSIQFVRTLSGWRISAAAWDDERDGLSMDDAIAPGR
ncbi:hypothetical protein [Kineosporia babensis]|uniref:DUF4440 domain-containing protein n=1 Tax=Kineosporia babensis TaxID=499548 RepID=A0A9X1NC92_9ACTN|nr:hypothetical protein [Kineosporia babensis]MCD5311104.1 hypothetical protein [Kineosporia babensis]